jgi:hypothetical protein
MLNVWYSGHMESTFSVSVTPEAMTRLLPTLISPHPLPPPRRIVYPQFWLITLWDFNDIISAQKVIDPSVEWDEGMIVYEESVMDCYRPKGGGGEPQYGGLLSEHLFELT